MSPTEDAGPACAQPRSATESAVPVDVLSAADLVRRGAGDLRDQLRTIVPSFSVTFGIFFRNPNTRLGVFSNDGGRTLLVGDVLAANGMGSADCPTVTVTDNVPDQAALRRVIDDPN